MRRLPSTCGLTPDAAQYKSNTNRGESTTLHIRVPLSTAYRWEFLAPMELVYLWHKGAASFLDVGAISQRVDSEDKSIHLHFSTFILSHMDGLMFLAIFGSVVSDVGTSCRGADTGFSPDIIVHTL